MTKLGGIASSTNRNGTIRATTINGYRLDLSAAAYDAAAAVGADADADIRACVARLGQLGRWPLARSERAGDAVRDWFAATCLDGTEGADLIAAWTEYANEIASAAADQVPDGSEQYVIHVLAHAHGTDGWQYRISEVGDGVEHAHVLERRLSTTDPWLYVCDVPPGASIADHVEVHP